MTKYLNEKDLRALIGDIQLPKDFMPMSQDSYNEELIGEAINKTGKKMDLLAATINISVVGVGNKKYGNFRNGDTVIDIAMLLSGCGVKMRLPQGSILKEDELTVQRLCRFFRYHIRQWLISTRYQTYLYRKYSDHNPLMNSILFRGAEYLDDLTAEQSNYLRGINAEMDKRLNTNFVERFDRIRQAQSGERYV
jgi:hypothetical protein